MPVEPDRTPEEGYHFTEDMTDRAIDWVRQQKALMPDKPFFVYFAPGATHAPHHVPKEWSDKYKGRFDQGWDRLREETFARQKELGVIPPDAELTARPARSRRGTTCPTGSSRCWPGRWRSTPASWSTPTITSGAWFDALEDLEILDDTLIYYIIGDNGASAEGTINGTFNEMLTLNGAAALETTEFMASRIDSFGTPAAYNHYAVGWAHAMDTPYQWTKQVASHWGGTRNGTIVHWPDGIRSKGELRTQFHHVIDVAPTVLEAAGLPEPVFVNGVQQMPLHGVSMAYSFDDAGAGERRETQYFEMFVNRGIYHQGWTAVTRHSIPWAFAPSCRRSTTTSGSCMAPATGPRRTTWRPSSPSKLRELQRLFLIEAVKYNVLPLDDRRIERFNAELAGRPQLIQGKSQLLFGGMGRLTENSVVVLKNKSHAVSAQIMVPEGGANGVIVAQGGAFGGWSLYLHEGKPAYCYNLFGLRRFKIYGQRARRGGRAPDPDGVRLRRRRPGEGGLRLAVRRRGQGGRGAGRRDGAHDLLRRRNHRCRHRRRDTRQRRLRPQRQPVHRPHQLGPARHRRGRRRPRPPDHTRRAAANRDGPAMNS